MKHFTQSTQHFVLHRVVPYSTYTTVVLTHNTVTPYIQFCVFYVQYGYLHYYSLHLLPIFQCFTYNITLQNSACFTCITIIYTAFRYTVYTTSFYIRYYCTLYTILCILHTVFFFTPPVELCLLRVHNSVLLSAVLYTFYTQLFMCVLCTAQLSAPLPTLCALHHVHNCLCFAYNTITYSLHLSVFYIQCSSLWRLHSSLEHRVLDTVCAIVFYIQHDAVLYIQYCTILYTALCFTSSVNLYTLCITLYSMRYSTVLYTVCTTVCVCSTYSAVS
jgi:hypothetical protein